MSRDPIAPHIHAELSTIMDEVAAIADILGAMAMAWQHTGEGVTATALFWLNERLGDADQRGHEALGEQRRGAAP